MSTMTAERPTIPNMTDTQIGDVFKAFKARGFPTPNPQNVANPQATQEVGSSAPDPIVPRAYWWGFNIYFSGTNITWLNSLITGASAGVAAVVSALSGIPILNAVLWVFSVFIVAELAAILAMNAGNGGKGVYVSMLWFVPGVFVPTPA